MRLLAFAFALLMVGAAPLLRAQAPTPPVAGPTFEVASIKQNTSGATRMSFSFQPGGRMVMIFTALQEQLGLRLEPERSAVDYLIVDSIERPTVN